MTFRKGRSLTFAAMKETDSLYPDFQLRQNNENFSVYKHLEMNLLMVVFHPFKTINIEDAKHIEQIVLENADEKKDILGITLPSKGANVDSTARTYFANCELSMKYTKAMAVIVKSMPHRMLLNFYMQFNRPLAKHRAFEEVDKAMVWLRKVSQDQ